VKNLTWQNPEQLFVAQELINKVKSKCCGIKDIMKSVKTLWLSLFLLMTASASAQNAVTVGSQITAENQIVSGKAYVLRHGGNGTAMPYIKDNGTDYDVANAQDAATTASVYFLISNGDGTYKVKNYYTNKYWGVPSSDSKLLSADEGSAGAWSLNFSNNIAYPSAPDGDSQVKGLDRANQKLYSASTGTGNTAKVYIYEVALSSSALSELTGKDIFVETNSTASLTTGQWYVMKNQGADKSDGGRGYAYENLSTRTFFNTATGPSVSATDNAKYLVRLLDAGDGKYYLQSGYGNYMGAIANGNGNSGATVPVAALDASKLTINKIASTDGHFYIQNVDDNVVLNAVSLSGGDAKLVGWGTSAPGAINGNDDWAFYPVFLAPEGQTPVKVVYQTNGENVYGSWDGSKSTWTSKVALGSYMAGVTLSKSSGTFDCFSSWSGHYNLAYKPDKADTDETLTLTAPEGYVIAGYSLLAAKAYSADHTYTLTAEDGTSITPAFASSASGYTSFDVINVNKQSTTITVRTTDTEKYIAIADFEIYLQRESAIGSALTATPNAEGWYAIRVQSTTNNSNAAANNYLYTLDSEYNNTYPLSHDAATTLKENAKYYFRIIPHNGNVYCQMPNGRYLATVGGKFPASSLEPADIDVSYQGTYMRIKSGSYYADAYAGFIGETTSTDRTKYDVYPVKLGYANLTAWQILCDDASETSKISCSRTDVSGLTSVYKNGYIFLPSDVTPESTDFSLDGITDITVDATAKTVTLNYAPGLAIVADGISVEQGWQTAGRNSEVMLLKVTASPFKDATNASLCVSLKDGSEANISDLTLYEASTNSPEILSAGNEGAPLKTRVATTSVSGTAATLTIGNLSAGTHYYWLAATVKDDAVLGAVVDAAVTSLTYTCNSNETTLDLTSAGDPADRGAMVFNTRTYPFLPWDNGSHVYRIPAMVVANDGSIIVACDKRYNNHTDIGVPAGHVIDIVVRRSTDGGKTWSAPVVIAKGQGSTNTDYAGFGDPSLIKGKDGKIYCFFAAGNRGYFNGLNKICMSTSSDNGVTWDSNEETLPTDLVTSNKVTDHAISYGDNTCYGLYDYFVTSGRGLCTSEGYLMALLPAQPYTDTQKTQHTSNSQDYIFYSTDQGETWHISENAIFTGGDEAKIIQANDGSLIASIRQGNNRGFNTATYTSNGDGTLTFTMGTQYNNSQLNAGGYANNQDIFYYQRETTTGKTDIIFHSMTTGQHANLKLYYSLDQGANWIEFLNVQTKGTRYVTMEKSGTEENPGSLYLFFEDQSLNSAGDNTATNHYPLNFLEITREQLLQYIPELDMSGLDVKIVYKKTGESTYGTLSGDTWTSNVKSGTAGLTLSKSDGDFNQFSNWNEHYNIAYKPAAANVASTLTLTAPEGYIIKGYSLLAAKAYSATHTYTLTAEDGTSITPAFASSSTGYTAFNIDNVNAKTTTISVTTTDASKYIAIADFVVTLTQSYPLSLSPINGKSYATLYLPYGITLPGDVTAYKIRVSGEWAVPTSMGQELPANTAALLVSESGVTSALATLNSSASADATGNALLGVLTATSGEDLKGYVLNIVDGELGFFKLDNGGTLAANHAYLPASLIDGTGVKGVVLNWDEETGVGELKNESMEEGKSSTLFDLSGRRISVRPVLPKGIYILNGRKVIVK